MVLVALGSFTDFVLYVVPCTADLSAATTTASSHPCSASGLVAIPFSPMDLLRVVTLGPRPTLRPMASCLRGEPVAGPCSTTAPSGRGRGSHLGSMGR
jgi:hypothetical protein